MRRLAEGLLKGPAEMRRAQGDDFGESSESDGLLEVLGHISFDPPLLPGRQTAASKGRNSGPTLAPAEDGGKASDTGLSGTPVVRERALHIVEDLFKESERNVLLGASIASWPSRNLLS